MSRLTKYAATAIGFLFAGSLAAQVAPPPPYIQIFREREKVGHGPGHRQVESGWARAFSRAKTPNHYIAMTVMYGPPEAWFIQAAMSVAEIETANTAVASAPGLQADVDRFAAADAAHVDGATTLLARYVPDASNDPDLDVSEMRVWEITIFRVRPGREASFFEGAKLYQSVTRQAGVREPWSTYEIIAGMPGPTYLVFALHKTLAEIDPATGNRAAIMKAMNEESMKKFGTLSEGFISVETLVFSPSPEMSYAPAEWVKKDPKYWGRKVAASKP